MWRRILALSASSLPRGLSSLLACLSGDVVPFGSDDMGLDGLGAWSGAACLVMRRRDEMMRDGSLLGAPSFSFPFSLPSSPRFSPCLLALWCPSARLAGRCGFVSRLVCGLSWRFVCLPLSFAAPSPSLGSFAFRIGLAGGGGAVAGCRLPMPSLLSCLLACRRLDLSCHLVSDTG